MSSQDIEHTNHDVIKSLPKADADRADLNADPITGEPESHPISTGVGTTTGAIAGAVAGGLAAGPVGAAVGGVAGAVIGAAAGHQTGEMLDPTIESAYWRNHLAGVSYYDPQYTYERDYYPAYLLGYEERNKHPADIEFIDHENSLKQSWEKVKLESRLTWEQAKHAVKDAWESIKN